MTKRSHPAAGARRACRGAAYAALAACGPLLIACSESPSILDPRGPRAAVIAQMWWVMLVLAGLVFAIFVGLFLLAVVRFRAGADRGTGRPVDWTRLVVVLGIVLPLAVLASLTVYTNRTLAVLADPPTPPALTVEVVGHQFWWEVRYPERDVVTANEIHLPAGVPVTLRVTSHDVIHSIWTPQIHDKIDMIPGKTTVIWVQADEPGIYRGLCAEFCGIQHTLMQFLVVVQAPEEFDAWLSSQAEPAREPVDDLERLGEELFHARACVACHAIRGTDAAARAGPDLTHLASRLTLAAGILENTPAALTRWMSDPQAVKPGNRMPRLDLDEDELAAVVAYLLSLE